MKLKPFSFVYIFRNINHIHQSYRYCFVGNVDETTKTLLLKYQNYTQQEAFDNISEANKKKLESVYGEHWINLLYPKKLEKSSLQTGGGGITNVLNILNDVKMKKSDTDAIFLEPNNKLTPSKYPLKNVFIFSNPPTDDDNITYLQQKIQRYVRYSDNEFAILDPDYQYLWIERKGFVDKTELLSIGLSHKCLTSYDTTDYTVRPYETPKEFENIEKIEFLGDSLIEYIFNPLSDQIYLVDFWNENKGTLNSNYLKHLFPRVSTDLYQNSPPIAQTYAPSYLTLVNELKYKDNVANLFFDESETKIYKTIKKSSSYRITQCIFKGQTYNKINQQLFLDKLHMNKKFVFAKWTTSSKLYWGKVYTGFLDQIKTIQNWKSQNNLLRSIVIKLKLDISGDDSKYVTLTFRTMEDERTELSIKMNFKAHMNVTLEIINNEYLPYIISCVRELEKMCEFNILNKEFEESLSVYNITTEVNIILPNKSEIVNSKKNRIVSKLNSCFLPYSASEQNSILYIKTHNYLIEKNERINTYLRSNILEYGSNPPSNIITNISNVLKMPIDQVQLKYANVVKQVKTNTPNVTKSLEYKPNGIRIKNLFDSVKNINTFYLMGITSEREFHRLTDLITILSSLYYRYYVTKEDPELQKRLATLSKDLNIIGKKDEFENEESEKKQVIPKSVKRIKKLTIADPERNGYKPPKGTPGYSRLCQHQPDVVDEDEAKEYLGQKGFVWNEKIGGFEKDDKGEKIFAISLVSSHDNKKKFYYCDDPEYKHIGVTDPTKHPKKMVTACCFKLNQFNKADPIKKELFKTHSGLLIENMGDEDEIPDENFKKSYVYKDKPFVNIDRIGMLEKNLDIFLNKMLGNTITLTSDERLEETSGYFLKQGIDLKYEITPLIQVLLQITDTTFNEFKKKIYKSLKTIFRWLMGGDIALHYESPEQLQAELERTDILWRSNDFVLSIMACPGVFFENGVNIALFSNGFVDSSTIYFDKNNFKINYIPSNNWNDGEREVIMLIHDQTTAKQFVYPICKVTKEITDNAFDVQNVFLTKEIPNLKDLYEKTFVHLTKSIGEINILPRDAMYILMNNNIPIIGQVLNSYNKVSHLVVLVDKYKFLIPVDSKYGYLYDLDEVESFNVTLDDYLLFLQNLDETLKIQLQLIPKSVIVNNSNGKKTTESLKFSSGLTVPLAKKEYTVSSIKGTEINVSEKDFTIEELDKEILLRKKNEPYLDKMIRETNTKNYIMINYQYYRLHWYKYFTTNKEGKKHAKYLIDVLNNNNPKDAFKHIILYIDKLYDDLDFDEKNNKNVESNLSSIKYCPALPKNTCSTNEHCFWNDKDGQCRFQLNKEYKDHFLERLVSEMCMPGIYRDEIFGLNNNSVSEFWGENFKFEERKNELLFSSITDANYNFEYFVSNHLDTNQTFASTPYLTLRDISNSEEKKNNDVKLTSTHHIQAILHDSMSVFRLLANLYYYAQNPLLPSSQRILLNGSESQTKLAIEIRGLIFMKLFELNPDVKEDKLIPFISGMYNENNQALLTLENIFTIIRCFSVLNDETNNKVIIIHDKETHYFMNGKKKSTFNEKAEKLEFKLIKTNDLVTRFDAMFA